ncbi:MAG: hypothetical protein IJO91_03150 [Oscillospiraceae bacterium]|nr:hypothetical protein [Oscillospiraceae bacterium]
MKKAFIVAVVFAGIALFHLIYAAVVLAPCYKTTAVIDFIGLPQGVVMGSYTDESGESYKEREMFPTLLIGGNFVELETVEQYYGKEIDISINPHSGKIYYAPHLYAQIIPFAVISLVSAIVGAIMGAAKRMKKAPPT